MSLAALANIATIVGVILTFLSVIIGYVKTKERLDSIAQDIRLSSQLQQVSENISNLSTHVEALNESSAESRLVQNLQVSPEFMGETGNSSEGGDDA